MKISLFILLIGSGFLSGCAGSLSGYGGSSTFKCAAPEGVSCNSVSGNYANSVAGNSLYTVRGSKNIQADSSSPSRSYTDPYNPNARFTPSSGMPVRTQSEVMRVWIAPWQDNDGDLVDQSYTYVTLNEGRWLIEHNRKQIMDEYQPVRLLGANNDSKSAPATPNKNGQPETADTVPNILPLPGDLPK